jgi:hypothetical protein
VDILTGDTAVDLKDVMLIKTNGGAERIGDTRICSANTILARAEVTSG